MIFPDSPRVVYRNNPLVEVVAELRFEPILKIETQLPSAYQELIRDTYSGYREERGPNLQLPASIPNQVREAATATLGQLFALGESKVVHRFTSDAWTVSLARNSLSLSTTKYERWEEFRDRLDRALTALAVVYHPAAFVRVGLRYRDLIVRSSIQLNGVLWRELLKPPIASELQDIDEERFIDARKVLLLSLDDDMRLRLQHGLVNAVGSTNERAYLIDADFHKEGKTDATNAMDTLVRANREAGRAFRWCITPRLHDALEPDVVPVE